MSVLPPLGSRGSPTSSRLRPVAPREVGGLAMADSATGASKSSTTPTAAVQGAGSTTAPSRTVEETDIYRVDGNRLYTLNSYRGLMVFDITDIDHPQFLGRAPIFGSPVEMVVRSGIASVVVGDWYGTATDGTPFHGSVVRNIDATDPTHMKVLGDARLGGWVRDTRVVGDVLYTVAEDHPDWYYGYGWGWYGGGLATTSGVACAGYGGSKLTVTSVNIAGGTPVQKGQYPVSGLRRGLLCDPEPNPIRPHPNHHRRNQLFHRHHGKDRASPPRHQRPGGCHEGAGQAHGRRGQ